MSSFAPVQPHAAPHSRTATSQRSSIKSVRLALVALIGTTALVLSAVTPAHAEDPATRVASVVEAAVEEIGAEPSVAAGALTSSVDIAAPQSSLDDLIITPNDDAGAPLAIGLPTEIPAAVPTLASDGTIVYLGGAGSANLTIEPLADGVRLATVLTDDSQSTRYTYAMDDNVHPEPQADGSIALRWIEEIEAEEGTVSVEAVIGSFSPAWAIDAHGNEVETSYEIDDNRITQLIEPDADTTYPIVADPQYIRDSAFQYRVRWNRAETTTIAGGGWGASGLTAVCIAAGTAIGLAVGAVVLGAVCLGIAGSAVYTAGVAQNSSPRRCLQLLVRAGNVYGTSFQTYRGGYCR